MSTHTDLISQILGEFMEDIEEWSSNVAGSPSSQELEGLHNVFVDYIATLDKAYKYSEDFSDYNGRDL